MAAPAHEHEIVEAGLAAALAGRDVVGFALAGWFPAADARPVAGDERASLCCGGCSAGDGFIQRRELVAEDLDPEIGVAGQPPQGARRDRADTADLGDAARCVAECCEVGADDNLRSLAASRGSRPGVEYRLGFGVDSALVARRASRASAMRWSRVRTALSGTVPLSRPSGAASDARDWACRRRSAWRSCSACWRRRCWMRAPISASNEPRICTEPSSPFQNRTLRLRRLRRCCAARSSALWCWIVQRCEAWANSSSGSVLAICTRSASPCTASGLVLRAA